MALVNTDGQVVDVAVADLRYGPKVRQEVDYDHVTRLAAVLDRCPPIVVQSGSLAVIDGGHRVDAAKRLERPTIRAVFVECDDVEAWRIAVSSGSEHGKPLTLAERKGAAAHFIESTDWSDRRIADECGINESTAAALRPVQLPENPQLDARRKGKDDRRRPTDPAASREQIAALIKEKPKLADREIALRLTVSPSTVADVRSRLATTGDPQPPKFQTVPPPAPTTDVKVGDVVTLWPAKGCWKRQHEARTSSDAQAFAKWMDTNAPNSKVTATDLAALCPAELKAQAIAAARAYAGVWNDLAVAIEGQRLRSVGGK